MGCGASAGGQTEAKTPVKRELEPLPDQSEGVSSKGVALIGEHRILEQLDCADADEDIDLSKVNAGLKDWIWDFSNDELNFPTAERNLERIRLLKRLAGCLEKTDLESDDAFTATSQTSQVLDLIKDSTIASARQHVKRVTAGWGWALHGLAFELCDGTRVGQFLENDGREMDLLGDAALTRRGGNWQDLLPGERLLKVSGHNCREGYLAYDVKLTTNKERVLHFSADHEAWRGSTFEYEAPPGQEIEEVMLSRGSFRGCRCVSFADWSEESRTEVQAALQDVAQSVINILARSSLWKGPRDAKYALFQAQAWGLENQEVFADVQKCVLGSIELPPFWLTSAMKCDEVEDGTGLMFNADDKINLFGQVELNGEELEAMQGLFDASFRKRYTRDRRGGKVPDKLLLARGHRIQNAMNWAEYCARKEVVKGDLRELREAGENVFDCVADLKTAGHLPQATQYELDPHANSAWLYHGTNDEAAAMISRGDFLIERAGSNAGTLFGRGIYLAESCSKSDEYSTENEEGLRCILVCRVTLGNINYCDERRPDVDKLVRSCVNGNFHSVLGDREKVHSTFREFIVYDDDQVYPEYVLWYKRVYD